MFKWLWRHAAVSNLLRFSIDSRNIVFVKKIVNCNLFTHGRKHLGVLKNSLKRVRAFQIFTSTNSKISITKIGLKRIKEVLVSCALIPFKSYNTILGQICRHVGRNLSRDVRKKNFRQGVLVWWSFVCNNWKQFVRGNDKETCPCYVRDLEYWSKTSQPQVTDAWSWPGSFSQTAATLLKWNSLAIKQTLDHKEPLSVQFRSCC